MMTVPTPPNTRDERTIRDHVGMWAASNPHGDGLWVGAALRTAGIGDHETIASVASALTLRQQLALEPAENMALTIALAQVNRGEAPMPNIASVCVLALARLRAVVQEKPL